MGLGYSLGPVIGSAVYEKVSYAGTMYIFGGVTLINIILAHILLPSIVNREIDETCSPSATQSL